MAGDDGADFVALRLSSDGLLNTAFHTDGIVAIDFGGTETLSGAYLDTRVNFRPSLTMVGGNENDWVVARILTDGSTDTSFDTDGKLVVDFGTIGEVARAVQVNVWGDKVYFGGSNGSDFLFARFNSNGVLDTTFDTDGNRHLIS